MELQHASLHIQQEGSASHSSSEMEHFVSYSTEKREAVELICMFECN